jgi:hypothetical protein
MYKCISVCINVLIEMKLYYLGFYFKRNEYQEYFQGVKAAGA